ncbi:integral membrane protein, YjbE family [Thermoactinomyces sp. DSM 45891]|uniref:TerC family protein n=1 Tax=Thermoactinomyces sp. DSM 45891 TaxID=1761907 RepID=UPI0009196332|nr:TerC family protein [Thermoactinomyces sp. DSM 45891]SFX22898.1 integral membrane protein, YjbE family [Thermoactinomyces sp. DSM 45891]
MDLFTTEFLTALISIVIIDLVLAGDNAIVIGLAARNLPKEQQNKVIFWGTVGAVVMRVVATSAVVWLLKIPGLLLVGGILLLWISCKLLADDKGHEIEAKKTVFQAIQTIIIADTVMGLDNVLAVAGAAHGNYLLVILGLVISVPIIVWGSTLFLRLMDRFPWILYVGSGVLAWTAGGMLIKEKFMKPYFPSGSLLSYGVQVLAVLGVLAWGYFQKQKSKKATDEVQTS